MHARWRQLGAFLGKRRGDQLAMTFAGFIQQVEAARFDDARTSVHYDSSVTVEELGGSLDGSARPVSYGPQP